MPKADVHRVLRIWGVGPRLREFSASAQGLPARYPNMRLLDHKTPQSSICFWNLKLPCFRLLAERVRNTVAVAVHRDNSCGRRL